LYKFAFEVQDKKHFVVFNSWFDINEDQITDDLSKMVNWFYKMFGELPYEHYTFFLRVSEPGGGGIEHLYSNVSSVTPQSLKGDINDAAYYNKLLMLEAHEFFHLYNVKRIRPTGLGPFDYTDEVYTKMLWVSEGFTSYYTHRPLSKAGILNEDKIFESWSTLVNRLINNTAIKVKPVSQYSFDAWLRSDIPDYSFRTYYTKGALIALLLDIDMRFKTAHKKNIDEFFRFLYHEVYKKNKTFNLESFYSYLFEYCQIDYSNFFNRYVTGINKLPIEDYIHKIGLQLNTESKIPFIGIKLNSKINNIAIVKYVYPNSPADAIQVARGDHILSINGEKVTKENWIEVLRKIELDTEVEIKWIHNNQVVTSEIEINKNQVIEYSIIKIPEISENQQLFLQELLLP